MNQIREITIGVIAALGLGAGTTAVHAHPGQQMGAGMGQHMQMQGGMHQGAQGGMQHGMKGGMGQGGMRGGHGGEGAAQLMTPEERSAFMEKMRSAKTPEERQQLAAANRAEMQKRAQEKGITLPEHRGPHGGGSPRAPSATGNAQ